MKELRKKILKIGESIKHKVTNSIGVYDIYKMLRKNKWLDIGRPLKEHEFYAIIRGVNNEIFNRLSMGEEIKVPKHMGTLILEKIKPKLEFKDGKLKTNLPINWDATLKLWEEDPEALSNKTLIRFECDYVYRLRYSTRNANYKNKIYYQFKFNHELRRQVMRNIKEGKVDVQLKYT